MKNLILLLLSVFILGSCSNKFSLQKRKYTKGFYLAHSHHQKSKNHHSAVSQSVKVAASPKEEVALQIVEANQPNEITKTETASVQDEKKLTTKVKSIKSKLSLKANQLLPNTDVFKPIKKSDIQIGKQEIKHVAQQKVVKKIIRILFGIIASLMFMAAGIAYLLSLADSTFFIIAVAFAAVGVLFIILSILLKAT